MADQMLEQGAIPPTERGPIVKTENSVSYLGVRLPKATNPTGPFVPKVEQYADFIDDKEVALPMQKAIAVSWLQGQPILIEGGTSIGKTTTVRKMASELGYEVHYANLNGRTDVDDLMGKYIANKDRHSTEDPEFVFADGKVTSGLRQDEGKVKVVILDEINGSDPNVLLRMHEVLDALERDGDVVLTEDAAESIPVSRAKTKVVGLANPPGKGYFGREPLDPAQLRRWVYYKAQSELPKETFIKSTEALFGLAPQTAEVDRGLYLPSRELALLPEQLAEIPGITDILAKYQEFHDGAKRLVKERRIGADQPQLFTFDDRVEPKRVRDFVLGFYNGDITETFQKALRFYYANKVESAEDKAKLEEILAHVEYQPPINVSPRRGPDRGEPAFPDLILRPVRPERPSGMPTLEQAKTVFGRDFLGPDAVTKTFGIRVLESGVPNIPFTREELEHSKELGQFLVLREYRTPEGRPLTMKKMQELVEDRLKREGKGKALYDTDWYKDEEFFTNKPPRSGWALVSKELVPGSTDKDYMAQTELLANYVRNTIFEGRGVPPEYIPALREVIDQKAEIERLMRDDWQAAAKKLTELRLNQMTRRSPAEGLYDLLMYFQNNDTRLLENQYDWNYGLTSGGFLPLMGSFDSNGLNVLDDGPGFSNPNLGVAFSRSK